MKIEIDVFLQNDTRNSPKVPHGIDVAHLWTQHEVERERIKVHFVDTENKSSISLPEVLLVHRSKSLSKALD